MAGFFGFLYFTRGPTTPGDTSGGGTNFLAQFNPFGNDAGNKPEDTPPPPVDISGYEPPREIPEGELLKISSVPVAGYTVFMKERFKEEITSPLPPSPSQGEGPEERSSTATPTPPPTEFAPALRYVDRATGNILQTFADKIEERKFSGTVIPKVYEAFFGNSGEVVIMRYLKINGKTIETFIGKLPKEILGGDEVGEIEVRGTLLPTDITDISISPEGKSAFYLFDSGETTIGTTLDLAVDKKVQVFDSVFNEWLSQWPNARIIALTTKPSYLAPGYMYKLDPSTKVYNQVLADISGLTTLVSPDGKMALYANNTLALSIYHIDTKVSESLGVRTLPEKCVWGKGSDAIYCAAPRSVNNANYPDVWYQGEVSFDDQIWKVDVVGGSASILLDPVALRGGEEIDGIKLSLDSEEKYLFFVNKKDSYLWEMKLK